MKPLRAAHVGGSLAFAAALLAVGGCDALLGVTDVPSADGGAEVHSRSEAGRDSSRDGTVDAKAEAKADAARDAEKDAGRDTSHTEADASRHDVGVPDDGGIEASRDSGRDGGHEGPDASDAGLHDAGHDTGNHGGTCNAAPCDGVCSEIVTRDAGTGFTCVATLAALGDVPSGIAVDHTNVYWTTTSPVATVMKMPLVGGTPTTLVKASPGPAGPYNYIATDGTSAYWTAGDSTNPNGTVSLVPVGGGITETIASSVFGPGRIVYDPTSTNVVWVVADDDVTRLPVGTTTPVPLKTTAQPGYGLAVAGAELYVATMGGTIYACPLLTCTTYVVYATKPCQGIVLTSSGSAVYAATQAPSEIDGPVTGSFEVLASAIQPTAVAASAGVTELGPTTFVYYADNGSILRLDTTANDVSTLATGQTNVTDMAVDSTDGLYWLETAGGTGAVMKLSPR